MVEHILVYEDIILDRVQFPTVLQVGDTFSYGMMDLIVTNRYFHINTNVVTITVISK